MAHDTTTEGQVDAARVQQARTNLSAPVQALLTLLMEKSAPDDSTLPGNKQDAAHTAHTDAKIVAAIPCTTCGERLPQPGRLRCQECLDTE